MTVSVNCTANTAMKHIQYVVRIPHQHSQHSSDNVKYVDAVRDTYNRMAITRILVTTVHKQNFVKHKYVYTEVVIQWKMTNMLLQHKIKP